jgi:hypothetical protein
MIKVVKRSSTIQISAGSGISGQIITENITTAGATEEASPKSGSMRIMKVSAGSGKSDRLSNINERLRGFGRNTIVSTSD